RSLSLQRRTPRPAVPPQLSSAGYTAAALRPSVSVIASTPRNRVVGIRYTFVTASLLTSLPTGMPVHQSYISSAITRSRCCSQWGVDIALIATTTATRNRSPPLGEGHCRLKRRG